MVAQAVGGHQGKGQAPLWIGDAACGLQNLWISGQLAEAGPVQAVAAGLLAPVLR